MATPKIQLTAKLQEMIHYNQEADCDAARAHIEFLDSIITQCLHQDGVFLDESNILNTVRELDCIRQDYKAFLAKE